MEGERGRNCHVMQVNMGNDGIPGCYASSKSITWGTDESSSDAVGWRQVYVASHIIACMRKANNSLLKAPFLFCASRSWCTNYMTSQVPINPFMMSLIVVQYETRIKQTVPNYFFLFKCKVREWDLRVCNIHGRSWAVSSREECHSEVHCLFRT